MINSYFLNTNSIKRHQRGINTEYRVPLGVASMVSFLPDHVFVQYRHLLNAVIRKKAVIPAKHH